MKNYLLLFLILFFSVQFIQAQELPFSGTKNKKAEFYFGEALRAFQSMQEVAAKKSIEKALQNDPVFIDAKMLFAEIDRTSGALNKAKSIYNEVVQINPAFPLSYYYLTLIYFQQKQYDSVIFQADTYLKLSDFYRKKEDVIKLKASALFAKTAILSPVNFNPVNLGPEINTSENEYFPGITADDNTLIFTRLTDGNNEDFYISKKNNNKWLPSQNIGEPINTERNEGTVSLSADGQYIFYTACNKQGGFGSCDIYLSRLDGDSWTHPINLGHPVNSSSWESQPSVSFDGKTLYFSSSRPGGFGKSDIWSTTYKNGKWMVPVNLGPEINTAGDEQSPFIAKDDETLYFNSDGHPGMGRVDLFVAKKSNGKWTNVQNLGYPINTELDETCITIASNGVDAYMSREGADSYGGLDLYQFELHEKIRPIKTGYISGTTYDAVSFKKLGAKLELIELATGKTIVESYSNKLTGKFLLNLLGNKNYALNVSAPGYLFYSENFSLANQSSTEPLNMDVALQPIASGAKVVLNNIFFETDAFVVKKESEIELEKLIQFLNLNPLVKIEIGGHTDNTGDPAKNKILSTNRAKSVYDYLIAKQVNLARISYKGYADQQPIADNKTIVGRQKNRRTEFKIMP